MDEFYFAVEIFNQSCATFNPISAVQVLHIADHFHFGAVNVAADDAIRLVATRHGSERVFVFGDKFDGGLGLRFQKCGKRPVAKAHHASQAVEIQIEIKNPVVKMRAEFFEQVIEVS